MEIITAFRTDYTFEIYLFLSGDCSVLSSLRFGRIGGDTFTLGLSALTGISSVCQCWQEQ